MSNVENYRDFNTMENDFSFHRMADGPPPSMAINYSLPLRPNFLVQMILPRDLNPREVKRLCAFIETLAMPEPHSAGPSLEGK